MKQRTYTARIHVTCDDDHDAASGDLSDAATWIDAALRRSCAGIDTTVFDGALWALVMEINETTAHPEGWGIFDVDAMDQPRIQRVDDARVFDSDEAARRFITWRATQGSRPHLLALLIDGMTTGAHAQPGATLPPDEAAEAARCVRAYLSDLGIVDHEGDPAIARLESALERLQPGPSLGTRAICRHCDQDIEWSGHRYGWTDRGGNRACVPTIRGGEIVVQPEGTKHAPEGEQ